MREKSDASTRVTLATGPGLFTKHRVGGGRRARPRGTGCQFSVRRSAPIPKPGMVHRVSHPNQRAARIAPQFSRVTCCSESSFNTRRIAKVPGRGKSTRATARNTIARCLASMHTPRCIPSLPPGMSSYRVAPAAAFSLVLPVLERAESLPEPALIPAPCAGSPTGNSLLRSNRGSPSTPGSPARYLYSASWPWATSARSGLPRRDGETRRRPTWKSKPARITRTIT